MRTKVNYAMMTMEGESMNRERQELVHMKNERQNMGQKREKEAQRIDRWPLVLESLTVVTKVSGKRR